KPRHTVSHEPGVVIVLAARIAVGNDVRIGYFCGDCAGGPATEPRYAPAHSRCPRCVCLSAGRVGAPASRPCALKHSPTIIRRAFGVISGSAFEAKDMMRSMIAR